MKKKFNSRKKGQIWISAIIYTLVSILALVIILNTGIPLLTELRERAVLERVRGIAIELDNQIREIASQGEGSQATAAFDGRDGKVRFEDNEFIWEVETESELISPKTSTKLGNLVIASNANIKTYETAGYYVMETRIENDTFRAVINKFGSSDSWVTFNTSQIIENVSYNGINMNGTFTFSMNNDETSKTGNGYTEMVPAGNNTDVGRARVIAHLNTTFVEYDLEFILDSYADFLTVNVRNVEVN